MDQWIRSKSIETFQKLCRFNQNFLPKFTGKRPQKVIKRFRFIPIIGKDLRNPRWEDSWKIPSELNDKWNVERPWEKIVSFLISSQEVDDIISDIRSKLAAVLTICLSLCQANMKPMNKWNDCNFFSAIIFLLLQGFSRQRFWLKKHCIPAPFQPA